MSNLYYVTTFLAKLPKRKDNKLRYWTGDEWSERREAAAMYASLPIAKHIATRLAREWEMIVAVSEDAATTLDRRKAPRSARAGRRRNPVASSARSASVAASRERFEAFRGDKPGGARHVQVKVPASAMEVGTLDGVLYTTVRDGKTEKYIHKFRRKSRPLLAASDDGKSLHIVGGQYEFTERGIIDK